MNNKSDGLLETDVSQTVEKNVEAKITDENDSTLQYNLTCNIRLPKPEEKIAVSVSEIKRIKGMCKEAMQEAFPVAEVCLGVATLLIGAFLSAIIAQIHYENSILSVFFYTVCPAAGIGCGVAYIFNRKKELYNLKQFANTIDNHMSKYFIENDGGESI